jgi:curved DNA-binding protein CbpA
MDRFPGDDPHKDQVIFKNALEFIGAVRAGISWERFCMYAVRFSDALISMLNGTNDAQRFLSSRGISTEYVQENVGAVFTRLHLNRDHDHYLTLALPRYASDAQIHRRWKELMRIYHPDRNSNADAALCAKRINEAYSVLKNPRQRTEYDRKTARAVESHFTSRRTNVIHPHKSNKSGRRLFISPELRRMVPKLIIASSLVLSCVVLLIIFFKNRPAVYTYQASVLPQQDRQYDGKDHLMTDSAKEESAEGEEKKIAGVQTALVPGQDANRPVGAPSERSRKGMESGVTNPETLYPYGSRPRPADITTQSTLPSQPAQDRPMADTRAGLVQKTPAEHAEVSPLTTTRLIEPPEQNTKKESPLPSPQKRPSLEQKGTAAEMASVTPSASASGENRPDLETEVFLFLAQYIVAYEEGDITRFMDLFSKSAVENNNLQYADIKKFYAKNFEGGRYNYTLRNVRVRKSEEPLIVSGEYSISRVTDGDKGIKTVGTIRWGLSRENGNLKIVRIDYERK